MTRTSIVNLAIISVIFFNGILTVNPLKDFNEEEDRGYSDLEEDNEFESRHYGNQQNGFCIGKRDGHYINPANPHSYYQCRQNGAITNVLLCVSGTVYDPPPYDRCEWPDQVRGCNGRFGNCRDKEPIISLPVVSLPPPNYVREDKCNGRPQCKSCKPPTVPSYQPSSRRNARETRQLMQNLDESEVNSRNVANNYLRSNGFCIGKRDGNYINPANPHSLYQCHQNGVTYELPCVSGTVYDPPPYDRCEWPDQVRGCNGGYGKGCGQALVRATTTLAYPVYPIYTKPPPRQCNAICETNPPSKVPPVTKPYVVQYGKRNGYGG